MGGYGSGRRLSAKSTTESQHKVDISWMKKEGCLESGSIGTLSWTCRGEETGSISYRTESDKLVLFYRSHQGDSEWEDIEDVVYFTWTPCNFGGRRQWFLCPGCQRRVAVIYGGKYFRCRHCHNLTYASQQETKEDRLMRKARKIRRRLGGGDNLLAPFPWKPKHMHWETYERLRWESKNAHDRSIIMAGHRMGFL